MSAVYGGPQALHQIPPTTALPGQLGDLALGRQESTLSSEGLTVRGHRLGPAPSSSPIHGFQRTDRKASKPQPSDPRREKCRGQRGPDLPVEVTNWTPCLHWAPEGGKRGGMRGGRQRGMELGSQGSAALALRHPHSHPIQSFPGDGQRYRTCAGQQLEVSRGQSIHAQVRVCAPGCVRPHPAGAGEAWKGFLLRDLQEPSDPIPSSQTHTMSSPRFVARRPQKAVPSGL